MLGALTFLGASMGSEYLRNWGYGSFARRYTRKAGISASYSIMGGKKASRLYGMQEQSMMRSYYRGMERNVWETLWKTKGGISSKWAAAKFKAEQVMTNSGISKSRITSSAITRATGAAIGSNLLKIGLGYMVYGFIPPMLADMAVGGFNTLSDIGRQARQQGPNTGIRFVDTEQAATMRQAGLQAMYESGMGGHRNVLGNEAAMYHR